jgi:hypothetical protein
MTAVQNATLISAALGAVGTIALFLGSYILEPAAEISHDIGLLLLFLSFVMQAVSVILSWCACGALRPDRAMIVLIAVNFLSHALAGILEVIARSRTEPASRVERARILLAYRSEPSSTAVGAAAAEYGFASVLNPRLADQLPYRANGQESADLVWVKVAGSLTIIIQAITPSPSRLIRANIVFEPNRQQLGLRWPDDLLGVGTQVL